MLRLDGDCPRGLTGAEPLVLDLWKAEAERGAIWVPYTVTNAWAAVIRMALYRLRSQNEVRLLIDCAGGHETSFEPCYELWWRWRMRGDPDPTSSRSPYVRKPPGIATVSIVLQHARSIGLSYSVCATHRQAYPGAVFAVHGGSDRWGERVAVAGRDIEGLVDQEDHFSADWLARFTKQPYEFWLDLVSSKRVHEFGVAEALAWGVIDEILEGV